MAKEDATGQAVEPSMEQLLDINRKQSEIISAQARTIEELRGTIVELNASLAWLKRKVFGKYVKVKATLGTMPVRMFTKTYTLPV